MRRAHRSNIAEEQVMRVSVRTVSLVLLGLLYGSEMASAAVPHVVFLIGEREYKTEIRTKRQKSEQIITAVLVE